MAVCALSVLLRDQESAASGNPWNDLAGFRVNMPLIRPIKLRDQDETVMVEATYNKDGSYDLKVWLL